MKAATRLNEIVDDARAWRADIAGGQFAAGEREVTEPAELGKR